MRWLDHMMQVITLGIRFLNIIKNSWLSVNSGIPYSVPRPHDYIINIRSDLSLVEPEYMVHNTKL